MRRRKHGTPWRLLALAALVGCSHGITTAPEGSGATGKFDKVWQDFDQHYAFFEYGSIDWNALRARYRVQITDASSDRELATAIGSMIGELRDYHADLKTPFGTFGPPPIPYPQHFSPQLMQEHYFAAPIRSTASGRIQFTRLVDGTGYVYISSFTGSGWGAEISVALSALGSIPSLILDIRNNGGGDESIALDVAGRFYDKQRVYRVSRFRNGAGHGDFASPTQFTASPSGDHFAGPVALITNRFDGSSAEDFTLMMRVLPTVVTVGDTTLGLGSNPLTVTLSNGWSYRVPQSMQSTPDGFVYQWHGLPPSIPVAWADADTAAGRDPYIEAALRELKRRQSSASIAPRAK